MLRIFNSLDKEKTGFVRRSKIEASMLAGGVLPPQVRVYPCLSLSVYRGDIIQPALCLAIFRPIQSVHISIIECMDVSMASVCCSVKTPLLGPWLIQSCVGEAALQWQESGELGPV